ncbi:hypothetical protein NKG05_17565 [Oerskovia sp. M15]
MTQARGRPGSDGTGAGAVEAARKAFRRLLVRARLRQGSSRVRVAFWPIIQASVAAGIAYGIAHFVFGHPYPFFAPSLCGCAWASASTGRCGGWASSRSASRWAWGWET